MTRPSAADQLAGFFAGAARIDAQLRDAAKLINGGVHRDVIGLAPATVAAVRAIQPRDLVDTIPGGMEPELLRLVLLVYSDLVSRREAMNRVVGYASSAPLPRDSREAKELISCLGNGSPAARRFPDDLATARALAAASEPLAIASPQSRQTAEVALRAGYIDLVNGGCDTCGGTVLTKLVPLVWKKQTVADTVFDGTVGGVNFQAKFDAESGWTVHLNAC